MPNAFHTAFDALQLEAMKAAGLADSARYTPASGGPSIPCTVEITQSLQTVGTQGQVINNATLVIVFAHEIGPRPDVRSRFVVDGKTYTVDAFGADTDSSRYVCVVKDGF